VDIKDELKRTSINITCYDRNDRGDTLRQSIVTDRYCGRDA